MSVTTVSIIESCKRRGVEVGLFERCVCSQRNDKKVYHESTEIVADLLEALEYEGSTIVSMRCDSHECYSIFVEELSGHGIPIISEDESGSVSFLLRRKDVDLMNKPLRCDCVPEYEVRSEVFYENTEEPVTVLSSYFAVDGRWVYNVKSRGGNEKMVCEERLRVYKTDFDEYLI